MGCSTSHPRRGRALASVLACGVLLAGCRIGDAPDAAPTSLPSDGSTEVVEELATPAGRDGDQALAVLRYGVAEPPAAVARVDEYPSDDDRSLTLVYLDASGQTLAIQRNGLDPYDCVLHEMIAPSVCSADGSRNGTSWVLYRVEDPAAWTELEMVPIAEAPWADSEDSEDVSS